MKSLLCRMVVLGLMALISFPAITHAQNIGNLNMEWVKFESGQGPVTGGVAIAIRFGDDRRFVEVSAQSRAAWITLGRYFKKGNFTLDLGGSIGHQQDAFWAGPYVDAYYQVVGKVGFGLLYRSGFFEEEPTPWKVENDGSENPESIFMGNFGGIYLDVGTVSLSYYLLDFMDDPVNELPGASISFLLGGGMEASFGATRNTNAKTWMWLIGAKWSPGGWFG